MKGFSYLRSLTMVTVLALLLVFYSQSTSNTFARTSLDFPDPFWRITKDMNESRAYHTLSLLPNGKVLATGGYNGTNYLNSSEIYDPIQRDWTLTSNLTIQRSEHTATPLLDGRILVVGGKNATDFLKTAEIYDPQTGNWSETDELTHQRAGHTATRLKDGRVLVIGGCNSLIQCNNSAEIYNPSNNNWTLFETPFEDGARTQHTATLLANGKVLISGGWKGVGISTPTNHHNTAYLFDPALNNWSKAGNMNYRRSGHAAVLRKDGTVLVAGGRNYVLFVGEQFLQVNEYYNPSTNTWTIDTGNLPGGKRSAPAILDPFGEYFLIGGISHINDYDNQVETRNINETDAWSMQPFFEFRRYHAGIQLTDGTFLTSGGFDVKSSTYLKSANLYRDMDGESDLYAGITNEIPAHTSAVTLNAQGDVVIAGGTYNLINCAKAVYVWRTFSDSRDDMLSMNFGRCLHTATLLPDGRILVIGGSSVYPGPSPLKTIEIFDGSKWSTTTIDYELVGHKSILLANGKILIVPSDSNSAYMLDPLDLSIRKTNNDMNGIHTSHTATLLPNGKVLIVGANSGAVTAEVFDPATETFTNSSPTTTPFNSHTATLMPDGKVLIAGGRSGGVATNTVYRYTPLTNQWFTMEDLFEARYNHSAVLLQDGRVAVIGGRAGPGATTLNLTSIEIYHPNANTWENRGNMINAREGHATILTPQGYLLTVGGIFKPITDPEIAGQPERFYFHQTPLPNSPLFSVYRRPTVNSASFSQANQLNLSGAGFLGPEEATSGITNQSATNQPVVQAIRLDNQQMTWFFPGVNSSDSEFKSTENPTLPQGAYLMFVYTNGAFSQGKIVFLSGLNSKVFLPTLTK